METFADSPFFFFMERPEFLVGRADGKIVELSDAACDARESLAEFHRGRNSSSAAAAAVTAAAAARPRWNYYYPREVTNDYPTTECRQCGEKRELHFHPSRNPNYQRGYEGYRMASTRSNNRRIPRDWNWYTSQRNGSNNGECRRANLYQQLDYQNFANFGESENEEPRDRRKRRSKWSTRVDSNSSDFDSTEFLDRSSNDFQFYQEDLGSRRRPEDVDPECRIRQEEDLEARMRQDSGVMLATDQESFYESEETILEDRRIGNPRLRRFVDRAVDRDSLSNVSNSECSTIGRKSRSFTKVPVDDRTDWKNGFWEFIPLDESSDRQVRTVDIEGATDSVESRDPRDREDPNDTEAMVKKSEMSTQAGQNKIDEGLRDGETVEEWSERFRTPKRAGSGQKMDARTKKLKVTSCESSMVEDRSKMRSSFFERTSARLKRKFASEKSRSEDSALTRDRLAKGKRSSELSRLPVRIGPRLRSRNPSVRRNSPEESKMADDLPKTKEQNSVRSRTKPRIRPSILQTNRMARV